MTKGLLPTVAVLLTAATLHAAVPPLYKDPSLPVDTRLNDLVSRLTLDEKIKLLGGTGFTTQPIPRLDVPAFVMSDGPVGTRNAGPATAYPAGVALAASFNVENAKAIGVALGRDARARGVHILLGPAMNIYRSPLCGRNFEYLGEDPVLAGQLASGYIEGLQSEHVAATIKHFAGNEQEFDRHNLNTIADERTLREIYLRPFQIAVETAHPWCVMTSYNPLNGVHASQNHWLITDILKNEWHFPGLVMSDWTSCYDTLGMANGGLDLEMPTAKFFTPEKLKPLLDSGQVTEATIDDKVRRIFRVAFSMGWFDHPQQDDSITVDDPQNRATALNGARDSLTLLKNDNHLLPLDRSTLHSVVLVGPCADPAVISGGGSAAITPSHPISILQGLQQKLGNSVTITRIPWTPPGLDNAMVRQAPSSGTWHAEFFTNQNLEGTPALTRDDKFVDFHWRRNAPADGVPHDHFSARWTGTIRVDKSGPYVFATANDDGARVYVNGQRIIDDWRAHAVTQNTAAVALDADKDIPVVIEYFNDAQDAQIRFGWSAPRDILPAQYADTIKGADVVLACLGFNDKSGATAAYEGEGSDRPYALPQNQLELLTRTVALNSKTAVLVTAGGAVDTTGWLDNVPALLMTWYPGTEGGAAVADTLLGDNDPSGKLPFTWEHTLADYPATPNYPSKATGRVNDYKEGVFVGYRRQHLWDRPPLFPFGFGLSYTTFQLGEPKLNLFYAQAINVTTKSNSIGVEIPVTNTGKAAGSEVVQLYATPPQSDTPRPDITLVAFTKVSLAPGETKTASLHFSARDLQYWNPTTKAWSFTPGSYTLRVATSSLDPGKTIPLPLKADGTP